MNQGEINLLKTAGLTEVTFDVMIPHQQYPFAVYVGNKFKKQPYFIEKFEELKNRKTPFQFIICRFAQKKWSYGNNFKVSLEEYSLIEEAGKGFDLMVNVKLKQYRDYKTTVAPLDSDDNEVVIEKERSAPEPIKSYTVSSGDTLWKICKKYLGDGSKYKTIAQLNKIKNPNLIYPGQVIQFE